MIVSCKKHLYFTVHMIEIAAFIPRAGINCIENEKRSLGNDLYGYVLNQQYYRKNHYFKKSF